MAWSGGEDESGVDHDDQQVPPAASVQPTPVPKVLYGLAAAYLLLDYGRPQDTIPALGLIRPAMVVTILLAVAFLVNRESWVRGSAQQRCILAFMAIVAAHIPFAVNNFYAYQTMFGLLLYLPLVFSLPICITSLPWLRGTLGFCVLLMAYQAGFGLLHGGVGTGSQFSDENDFSLYLNTYLPFAFLLFAVERRVVRKIFYLVAAILGLMGNVISLSRGGFFGLLGMGSVTWLVSRRKILSLTLVAVIAGGFFLFAGDTYWHEMSTSTDASSGTGKQRVESWKSGWHMFVHNPLGVGGNNFQVRFSQYQTEFFSRGMWGRVAHSLWVTLIAELGVPGALVYGLLLFYNIRDSLRIRAIGLSLGGRDGRLLAGIGSAFLAAMAGFFASATFLSVLYYPHYWYLTGFIVAATRVATSMSNERLTRAADSPQVL